MTQTALLLLALAPAAAVQPVLDGVLDQVAGRDQVPRDDLLELPGRDLAGFLGGYGLGVGNRCPRVDAVARTHCPAY